MGGERQGEEEVPCGTGLFRGRNNWYLEAVPELLEVISRRLEQLPEALS